MTHSLCILYLHWTCIILVAITDSYHLVDISLNWTMAEIYCQQKCNSNLASIHSDSDYLQIMDIVNATFHVNGWRAWFGLNDIENEMHFVYTDESSFDFANDISTPGIDPWVSDSPANDSIGGNQDCGTIIKWINLNRKAYFSWNDDFCHHTHAFICNDCTGNTTTPSLTKDYHFVNEYLNWNSAEVYCKETCNSNLASIHSESDFDQIARIFEEASFINKSIHQKAWFGLHDIHNEMGFVFSDNSSFDWGNDVSSPGNYPWAEDSPANDSINGDQDCGNIIRFKGQGYGTQAYVYNDDECYELHRFFCNQCSSPTPAPYTIAPSDPSTAPTISPSITSDSGADEKDEFGSSEVNFDIFICIVIGMVIIIIIQVCLLIFYKCRKFKHQMGKKHGNANPIILSPHARIPSGSISDLCIDDVDRIEMIQIPGHTDSSIILPALPNIEKRAQDFVNNNQQSIQRSSRLEGVIKKKSNQIKKRDLGLVDHGKDKQKHSDDDEQSHKSDLFYDERWAVQKHTNFYGIGDQNPMGTSGE